MLAAGLSFGLVVTLQSGCARTSTVTQPAPEAVPHSTQSNAKPAAASGIQTLSGKVVETMDASGYTYVCLEKDGQKSWVAVPATKVTVGQEIEVLPGMQMGQFTSKSLKRTFEEIVFSSGLVIDTKVTLPSTPPPVSSANISLPPGHRPLDAIPQIDQVQPTSDTKTPPKGQIGMMGQPSNGFTAASGKVVETMDSGGYTYICLESGGKKVWAAAPTMKVLVGQELTLQPGQEMPNFKSKSLNRTFDSVIFSGGALPTTK